MDWGFFKTLPPKGPTQIGWASQQDSQPRAKETCVSAALAWLAAARPMADLSKCRVPAPIGLTRIKPFKLKIHLNKKTR